jgi:ATP-dependent Clp protease ATP-binding subunit ClpA
VEILKVLKTSFEEDHSVKCPNATLHAAELSVKFIKDR